MSNNAVAVYGVEIRRRRLLKGWDQVRFANRVGYSTRTIQRAENGGPLHITTLVDIASTLGCEPRELIAGVGHPARAPITQRTSRI